MTTTVGRIITSVIIVVVASIFILAGIEKASDREGATTANNPLLMPETVDPVLEEVREEQRAAQQLRERLAEKKRREEAKRLKFIDRTKKVENTQVYLPKPKPKPLPLVTASSEFFASSDSDDSALGRLFGKHYNRLVEVRGHVSEVVGDLIWVDVGNKSVLCKLSAKEIHRVGKNRLKQMERDGTWVTIVGRIDAFQKNSLTMRRCHFLNQP